MNREEILAKAQQESKDEMEVQVRDQSMRWTYITMVLAAAVFAYLRGRQGLPIMDLCVTVCASVAVGHLYRFGKTKKPYFLGIGVLTLAVGIFALVRFLMGH